MVERPKKRTWGEKKAFSQQEMLVLSMFEPVNSKVTLGEYSSSQVGAPEQASLSWVVKYGSGSQMTGWEA